MSEYAVEKRETAPKNFFAGDFPTVPETGVAGAEIKEYAPVMVDTENETKSFRLLQQRSERNRNFCGSSRKGRASHILFDR